MIARLCLAALISLALPHLAFADAFEQGFADGINDTGPKYPYSSDYTTAAHYQGGYDQGQTEAEEDEEDSQQMMNAGDAAIRQAEMDGKYTNLPNRYAYTSDQ